MRKVRKVHTVHSACQVRFQEAYKKLYGAVPPDDDGVLPLERMGLVMVYATSFNVPSFVCRQFKKGVYIEFLLDQRVSVAKLQALLCCAEFTVR